MKIFSLAFFFIVICFFSCQQKETSNASGDYEGQVQFLEPRICCANLELMNQDPVFSPIVGYKETILDAINIDDFRDLGFENGDSLRIEYNFGSERTPCFIECNRHNGIPIELVIVEKI